MARSRIALLVIAALLASQHVAGAAFLRNQLWGTHTFGYLPIWAGALALLLLAAASLRFMRGLDPLPLPRLRAMGPAAAAVILGGAGGTFWFLRIRHDLLGDALVIKHSLPQGIHGHPRQPLAKWLQLEMYELFEPLLSTFGGDEPEVAARCVALASVLFGLLFLFFAWKLAGRLAPSGSPPHERLLFPAILAFQGASLLFFGYVENYTSYQLGVLIYLYVSISHVQRRVPLIVPGVALALLMGLHLSSFVFWPSFALLLFHGARKAGRRAAVLRDLALTGGAFAFVAWWLNAIDPAFHIVAAYRDLLLLGRGSEGLSYMFSPEHLRDWAQEQLLAGPVTLLFWLPLSFYWWRALRRDLVQGFLMLAAISALAATFAADEPMLGYARDWDLFLPALLAVTVSALALGWRLATEEGIAREALSYTALLSLLGFAPWVALNLSEQASLVRMGELPLGRGRAAVVVGNWHLRQGDSAQAREWFERALADYPANNTAMSLLGRIALESGDIERAIGLYERAIALQPRKVEYRERMTRLLVEQGRIEDSIPHFEALVGERPGDGSTWLRYAQALRDSGRPDDATECYRRASVALRQALESKPRDYQRNMDLGTVLASLGESREAEKSLRTALELRPDSPPALYQLAGVLVAQGRQEEARPYLSQLLRVDPQHPQRLAIERWLADSP